jgi:hypothetical protein
MTQPSHPKIAKKHLIPRAKGPAIGWTSQLHFTGFDGN